MAEHLCDLPIRESAVAGQQEALLQSTGLAPESHNQESITGPHRQPGPGGSLPGGSLPGGKLQLMAGPVDVQRK